MSTFNQGVPQVPTLINSSNVFIFGNTSSGNALSVQQLGAGNVATFQTTTGATAMFIGANGRVGLGTTNPATALDVYTGTMNTASVIASTAYNTSGTGVYQVAGTTVIDASRNLTNIGTVNAQGASGPSIQGAYMAWNTAYTSVANGTTDFLNQLGLGTGGWKWLNFNNSNQLSANCAYLSAAGGLTLGRYSNVTAAPTGGLICPGNVGIANTNPTTTLSIQTSGNSNGIYVRGDTNTALILSSNNTGALGAGVTRQGQISIKAADTADKSIQIWNSSSDVGGTDRIFRFLNVSTNDTLSILNNGNVGIGSASPITTLDVAGGTISGGAGNTTWRIQPQYVNSSPFPSQVRIANGWDPVAGTGQANYAGVGINLNSFQGGSQLEFFTSTTNNAVPTMRAIITAAGNVGIGANNPIRTLSVSGEIAHSPASTSSFYNICDPSGNNGGSYTLYFRGLAANGTSGVAMTSFYVQTSGATFTYLGTGTVYSSAGTLTNTNPSDLNLKSNITALSNALDIVSSLNPIKYNWKDQEKYGTGVQYGLVAQEVNNVIPEIVKKTNDGNLGYDIVSIIPFLIGSVKELSAENTALKAQLSAMDARLAALEAKLNSQ
jgi:hypothetical protein